MQFKSTRLPWVCLLFISSCKEYISSQVNSHYHNRMYHRNLDPSCFSPFHLWFFGWANWTLLIESDPAKSTTFIFIFCYSIFACLCFHIGHIIVAFFEWHYYSPMQLVKGRNKPTKTLHKLKASPVLNKAATETSKYEQRKMIPSKWRKPCSFMSQRLWHTRPLQLREAS